VRRVCFDHSSFKLDSQGAACAQHVCSIDLASIISAVLYEVAEWACACLWLVRALCVRCTFAWHCWGIVIYCALWEWVLRVWKCGECEWCVLFGQELWLGECTVVLRKSRCGLHKWLSQCIAAMWITMMWPFWKWEISLSAFAIRPVWHWGARMWFFYLCETLLTCRCW